MKKLIFLLILSFVPCQASAMRMFVTKGPDNAAALTPPLSDTVNDYALAANTAQSVSWPSGANYAIISASAAYWVGAAGQTATVPSTSITNGTGAAQSPAQISRFSDSSFSIISATAQEISVSFYQ